MEDGTSTATQSTDTTAEALMKGLQKQRRSTQGFPENAIVDSEEDDVVEEHEYLMAKMKKQRRHSQGYADGAKSSDEESDMVEINLNDWWSNRAFDGIDSSKIHNVVNIIFKTLFFVSF